LKRLDDLIGGLEAIGSKRAAHEEAAAANEIIPAAMTTGATQSPSQHSWRVA
jgi:hypothetical protein